MKNYHVSMKYDICIVSINVFQILKLTKLIVILGNFNDICPIWNDFICLAYWN